MIAYLKGYILKKLEKSLILDVKNVGYEVKTNTNLLCDVKENEEVGIFIHTHVREDDISLYGFGTHEELRLFKLLINVSGIGPKIGLELLNQPVEMITNAIYTGDKDLLATTPGLGKKTAEKIILELKNKVTPSARSDGHVKEVSGVTEVIDALENLGYNRHQITLGLKKLDTMNMTTEEIITGFLKESYQK